MIPLQPLTVLVYVRVCVHLLTVHLFPTYTHVYTGGVLHSIHQQRTHCGGQHSNQCVLSLLYSLPIRDQLLVVSHSD